MVLDGGALEKNHRRRMGLWYSILKGESGVLSKLFSNLKCIVADVGLFKKKVRWR